MLWQWQCWVSRVACSIFPRPWMCPFVEYDSPLHSLLWRRWYQAQRMVLHTIAAAACLGCCWGGSGTWYLHGGQWHFTGARLFVWPCVWCHTGTITAQLSMETTGSFCTGCTEHQLFLLSVEMQEGWGAPCVYVETS